MESSQSSHSIIGFLSFWGIPEWSSAEFFSIFFHFDSTRKARQMNDSAEFAHFLRNFFFLNFYALENSSNQKTISHIRLTFLLLSVSTRIWPPASSSKLKRQTHSSHFLRLVNRMSQLKMLQLGSIAIYIFIRKEWFERFVEINTEIRIWFVILESSQSSHSIIGFLSF